MNRVVDVKDLIRQGEVPHGSRTSSVSDCAGATFPKGEGFGEVIAW